MSRRAHLLTIPDVQRTMGWTRNQVLEHLDVNGGPWATCQEGTRRKISFASLQTWIDRHTRELRESVGLPNP